MASPDHVLSVGDCPVTPGAEVVLVLVELDEGRLVFWCPDCGTAWNAIPPLSELKEVNALDEVAPAGVRLATEEDVLGLELHGRSLVRVPYANWGADLDLALARGRE